MLILIANQPGYEQQQAQRRQRQSFLKTCHTASLSGLPHITDTLEEMTAIKSPPPFGFGQKVKFTKRTYPEHAGAIGRVAGIYRERTGFVFSVELECGDVIRELQPEEIEPV